MLLTSILFSFTIEAAYFLIFQKQFVKFYVVQYINKQRDNYFLKAESNRLKESLDNMEQLMRLQDCKDFFHFFAVLVLFFQFTF